MDPPAARPELSSIERYLLFSEHAIHVPHFRQFGLDDGVVDQLPERFESRFKTVQREQIKSDDIVLATDRNLLEDKSFSEPQEGHNVRIVMR